MKKRKSIRSRRDSGSCEKRWKMKEVEKAGKENSNLSQKRSSNDRGVRSSARNEASRMSNFKGQHHLMNAVFVWVHMIRT